MINRTLSSKEVLVNLVIGIATICFVAAFNSGCFMSEEAPDYVRQEQMDFKDRLTVPSLRVSALDYYDAYDANQVAFEETYRDKPLLLSGFVGQIRSGFLDTPYIDMEGSPNSLNNKDVSAQLRDSQRVLVKKIQKGDSVQLICQGSGKTLGTLYVDDCVIYAIAHKQA